MTSSVPFKGRAIDLGAFAAKKSAAAAAPGGPGAPALTELNAGQFVQESMNRPSAGVPGLRPGAPVRRRLARATVVAAEFGEAVGLVTVDVDAEPGIAEAFQVQAVPAMLALVGGRPVPLFQGNPDDAQLRDLFGQVVEVARRPAWTCPRWRRAPGSAGEPELPPLHQEAFSAIERDDLARRDRGLRQGAAREPARRGRACRRGAGVAHSAVPRARPRSRACRRSGAAAGGSRKQLAVADLDLLGGRSRTPSASCSTWSPPWWVPTRIRCAPGSSNTSTSWEPPTNASSLRASASLPR